MVVTYKPVGKGCTYTLSPMMNGFGEVITLNASRKREPVRSGLLLKSPISYPLGAVLQLDIKFPDQEYTYRAKCIASWVADEASSGGFDIGVTITGMDKLDRYGISVAIQQPEPVAAQPERPSPAETELLDATSEQWLLPSDLPASPVPQRDLDIRADTARITPPLDPPIQESIPLSALPDSAAPAEEDEFGVRESRFHSMEPETPQQRVESKPAQKEQPEPQPAVTQVVLPETLEATVQETQMDQLLGATTAPPAAAAPSAAPPKAAPAHPAMAPAQAKALLQRLFDALRTIFPDQLLHEPIFIDELFCVPCERVPALIREIIVEATVQTTIDLEIDGDPIGTIGICLPGDHDATPPPAALLVQLAQRLTAHPISHHPRAPLAYHQVFGAARIASAGTSVKGVLVLDETAAVQLEALTHTKSPSSATPETPPALPPQKPMADVMQPLVAETSQRDEDVTEQVNIVLHARVDDETRKVPLRAKLSELPPPPTGQSSVPAPPSGRQSMDIDTLIVEAFEGMEVLYGVEDRAEAAKFSLNMATQLISCHAGVCMLVSQEIFALEVLAAYGPLEASLIGAKTSVRDGLAGFAMKHGQVARADQLEDIKGAVIGADYMQVQNAMCAPIMNGQSPLGVIELYNSHSPKGFTREKADLLAYIGRALGAFLAEALPVPDPT